MNAVLAPLLVLCGVRVLSEVFSGLDNFYFGCMMRKITGRLQSEMQLKAGRVSLEEYEKPDYLDLNQRLSTRSRR